VIHLRAEELATVAANVPNSGPGCMCVVRTQVCKLRHKRLRAHVRNRYPHGQASPPRLRVGGTSSSVMNRPHLGACVLLLGNRVHSANSLFRRFDVIFPGRFRRLGSGIVPSALRLCVLTTAIAISMTFGCGTPHAILDFSAPSTATAGSRFTVAVTVTVGGKPDTIVNSYINFTSSDPAAVLPGLYRFTPADAGSHTWTNGFVLMTPGSQTISASLYDASGINGNATVTVSQ
jgi:hypothetical protein